MTKLQLVKQLEQFSDDMEVEFSYNFRDYSRTQVSSRIRKVREENVTYSDYCRMNKILTENEDITDNVIKEVIVLS